MTRIAYCDTHVSIIDSGSLLRFLLCNIINLPLLKALIANILEIKLNFIVEWKYFFFFVRFFCCCTLTVLIWVFYLPSMNRLFRFFFCWDVWCSISQYMAQYWWLLTWWFVHCEPRMNYMPKSRPIHSRPIIDLLCVFFFYFLVSIKFPLCLQTDECFIEWPCLLFIEWSWFLLFFLFCSFLFLLYEMKW